MDTPKVSVIVPVYQAEKYLEECLDSILGQTFSDFELLLIDDGSTDESGAICDRYAECDKRIIVIHKENEGVSIARNTALEIARGEYITFVDSDDILDQGFLEYGVYTISNTQQDLFISGLYMDIWENGRAARTLQYGITQTQIYTIKELLENIDVTYPQICICGPCCKLYKNEIIQRNNIRFADILDYGEDTYFNLDYFSYSKHVVFSQEVFYHYRRINEGSLFGRFHRDTYDVLQIVYSKMRVLMHDIGCSDMAARSFEMMYFGMLLGCIHEHYRFFNETTLKERIALIVKASRDSCIWAVQLRYIKNWKNRILLFLLRYKYHWLIAFIFGMKYRFGNNH